MKKRTVLSSLRHVSALLLTAAVVLTMASCVDEPVGPQQDRPTQALPDVIRPSFSAVQANLESYKQYLGGSSYRFFFGRPAGTDGIDAGPNFNIGFGGLSAFASAGTRLADHNDVLANDPVGPGVMQSEVSVASDDELAVVTYNDSRGFFDFAAGVSGWAVSTDGGASYIDHGSFPRMPTAGFIHFGDPDVEAFFGGRFYFADLCFDLSTVPVITGICVTSGHEGGGTVDWHVPVYAAQDDGTTNFLDKPFMAVDRGTGYVYVTYTRFSVGTPFGQIEAVVSRDRGHSFSAPVIVGPHIPGVVQQGSEPAVGPKGEVYVVWERGWLTSPTPEIVVSKSVDHGMSFGGPAVVAAIGSIALFPPAGYNRDVINDFPRIDVARNGRVFVTFHSGIPGDADIYVSRSPDGVTWRTPVLVNDDGIGAEQFWPDIVTVRDKVFVMWYDRRLNPGTALTDVFVAQSSDGGRSFSQNTRLSDVSTDWLATVSDAAPNFGDYNTIARVRTTALNGESMFGCWGDGRLGTPDAFCSVVNAY